jgi:hypothetical protein
LLRGCCAIAFKLTAAAATVRAAVVMVVQGRCRPLVPQPDHGGVHGRCDLREPAAHQRRGHPLSADGQVCIGELGQKPKRAVHWQARPQEESVS